ncbi:unnamed protein product [Schistosoma curassoni]|uniref:Ubiquitin-like domain-containing protein n=1 Tax=Schistosoma curassoni TaxID=6186 RepID=A0A183JKE5_9TREM|nr:unnamed protein product [Schistosoma curassoni]
MHVGELLNRPATPNPPDNEATHADLPTAVAPAVIEEIRVTIRQIKCGKAAEPYNIPAEALKLDIEATTKMFHVLFKKICEEELVATDWKEGYLINIKKKGRSQQV